MVICHCYKFQIGPRLVGSVPISDAIPIYLCYRLSTVAICEVGTLEIYANSKPDQNKPGERSARNDGRVHHRCVRIAHQARFSVWWMAIMTESVSTSWHYIYLSNIRIDIIWWSASTRAIRVTSIRSGCIYNRPHWNSNALSRHANVARMRIKLHQQQQQQKNAVWFHRRRQSENETKFFFNKTTKSKRNKTKHKKGSENVRACA